MYQDLKDNLESAVEAVEAKVAALKEADEKPHGAHVTLLSRLKQAALCCQTCADAHPAAEPSGGDGDPPDGGEETLPETDGADTATTNESTDTVTTETEQTDGADTATTE